MYLFAGLNYYPVGGADDFVGMASSREEALAMLTNESYDWWHLADGSMEIIESGQKG